MTSFIVGTYAGAGGPGLLRARLTNGILSPSNEPAGTIANASAGIRHGGLWYVVDEAAGRGAVHAGPYRDWAMLASVPSGGDAPCSVALHPGHRILAVANYGSGTVAVFQLDDDGLPTSAPAVHQNRGGGPVRDRQAGPHAHWVGFAAGGKQLLVADLGADRVFAFPVDVQTGRLGAPHDAYVAPAGSGPRQIVEHPTLPVTYLLSELASTLTKLRRDGDGFHAEQTRSTLPPGAGDSLGGAIAISRAGDRLHVTNRGHDSVATFAIDADGDVALLGHCPSGGRSPRYVLLLDAAMLVAHEQTGGVTLLALDSDQMPHLTSERLDAPGACFLASLEPA